MSQVSFRSFRSELESIEWDFANVENRGIHLVHWYPATFVSAIPGCLIPAVTRPGDFIVDPFCGTGATVVEAVRLGRRALGVDTNPVGTLVASAKLALPSKADFRKIRDPVESIAQRDLFEGRADGRLPQHPRRDELLRWYHPTTFASLARIQGEIEELPSGAARTVGRCVFSSILKNTSSQGRHWGWVCDNVAPKRHEIQPKDAPRAFLSALDFFERAVNELLEDMAKRGLDRKDAVRRSGWDVRRGDACDEMQGLREGSVDAIVTSPPYFGVADYVKSQRLTFLWFDRSVAKVQRWGEFEELRKQEVGARAFRHRRASAFEYRRYMHLVIKRAASALKPGGALCLVMGESKARGSTQLDLEKNARESGLRQEFASTRGIRATRRRIQGQVPEESVFVFVKD